MQPAERLAAYGFGRLLGYIKSQGQLGSFQVGEVAQYQDVPVVRLEGSEGLAKRLVLAACLVRLDRRRNLGRPVLLGREDSGLRRHPALRFALTQEDAQEPGFNRAAEIESVDAPPGQTQGIPDLLLGLGLAAGHQGGSAK